MVLKEIGALVAVILEIEITGCVVKINAFAAEEGEGDDEGVGDGFIPGDAEAVGDGEIWALEEAVGLGEADPEDSLGGPRGETSFNGISEHFIFLLSLSVMQGPSPNSIGTPRSALEKKTWLFLAKKIPKGTASTSTKSTIRFVRFCRFLK